MQASLRFVGIEVAIRCPPGRLEAAVLRRWGVHLGPVTRPDIHVRLDPIAGGRTGVRALDIRGGVAHVEVGVGDDEGAADDAIATLVGPMLVHEDALLVEGTVVAEDRRRGVRIGGGAGWVVLHRRGGSWRVATTGLGPAGGLAPQQLTPSRLIVEGVDVATALEGAASLAGASSACRSAARDLAEDAASSLG